MTALRTSDTTLEFPYSRSTGPVVGAFLRGLRQHRLLGIRDTSGRVLVPPPEYDPLTGASLGTELVEVGPEGTVRSWTWVAHPLAKHPLDRPFAFALLQPDGADSTMVHAVDAGEPGVMAAGLRVAPRWRAETKGLVTDIEAWEILPMSEQVKEDLVMEHLVSLTYHEKLTPSLNRFADALLDGRFVGHRCPSCRRVYIPPKGYCPLCVVVTTEEVALPDTGTLTAFTIITPVQYYGQKATEPFVYAAVILDGADTPLGGQDIVGIAHDQLRSGLRVKAVWRPEGERSTSGISNRGWGGIDSVVSAFEATGDPDAEESSYREHLF